MLFLLFGCKPIAANWTRPGQLRIQIYGKQMAKNQPAIKTVRLKVKWAANFIKNNSWGKKAISCSKTILRHHFKT